MEVAKRLSSFGETIFSEITRLARAHDAIDLGQGYPNFDGPDAVKDAAVAAIRAGHNQYAPSHGVAELRGAIAKHMQRRLGRPIDADTQVTVTSGCTEALAASFLGLVEPGDEVVLIEPYYDAYPVGVSLAGAVARHVTLRPPDFRLDPEALAAVCGPRTRMIVLNTPHNPTGHVFTVGELDAIAELAVAWDAIVLADEVYERLVFDVPHVSIASRPAMWERTVTLSSLGKSFSLTGWKVGWAVAPEPLTAGVRAAHQYLTFATATPLQHGAAAALEAMNPESDAAYVDAYRRRRDLLVAGLESVGFGVRPPDGTYFVLADHRPFGIGDDVAFVQHLIREVGVAAIPPSVFYHLPDDGADLVRFAFCKDLATLEAAVGRLQRLRGGGA